jgi:threonyl-tRNA synthetase
MLVVGDRESAEHTVSVRTRAGGDQGASALDDFITKANDEIARKARE